MYVRSGECNLCGECCGTLGRNPWPSQWPESIRNWQAQDIIGDFDYAAYLGITGDPGDPLSYPTGPQSMKIRQYTIPYEWGPGIHKPTNAECPFLWDDPGDGTRPCLLVMLGLNYEDAWATICQPTPPEEWNEDQVTKWFLHYPSCSYTYIEE